MAYWWTTDTSKLRTVPPTENKGTKRKIERERVEADVFRARKCTAIRQSNTDKWYAIIDEVDPDPWGTDYKILLKKFKDLPNTIMAAEKKEDKVDTLFQSHPEETDDVELTCSFYTGEVGKTSASLRNRKFPTRTMSRPKH